MLKDEAEPPWEFPVGLSHKHKGVRDSGPLATDQLKGLWLRSSDEQAAQRGSQAVIGLE